MPLTGVYISCGFIGARGLGGGVVPLLAESVWTEKMTNAGATGNSAPTTANGGGATSFEIRTFTGDIVFAYGAAPDPVNGPRTPLTVADGPRNVFCKPGDKVAWVAA